MPAYVLFNPALIPWGGSFVNLIEVYMIEKVHKSLLDIIEIVTSPALE